MYTHPKGKACHHTQGNHPIPSHHKHPLVPQNVHATSTPDNTNKTGNGVAVTANLLQCPNNNSSKQEIMYFSSCEDD